MYPMNGSVFEGRQSRATAPAAAQKAMITEWPKVGRRANRWVMNTDSSVYDAAPRVALRTTEQTGGRGCKHASTGMP